MCTQYVYKYRSGDNVLRSGQSMTDLERDLQCIEKNLLYASSIDSLNDPCEAMVFIDDLKNDTAWYSSFLKHEQARLDDFHNQVEHFISVSNINVGIYSLAGKYNHELLWAHYANSHKGFCIEYDFERLKRFYSNENIYDFPISYTAKPPQLNLSDFSNENTNGAINKIAGFKSKEWEYEQEIRLLFDKPKVRHYHPSAVSGIYFGLKMPKEIRLEIMKRLSGRKIKFYEIVQIPKTYRFDRNEIVNTFQPEFVYMGEIPQTITGHERVRFTISKLEYNWISKKGVFETQFEKEVSEDALLWLAKMVKEDLFHDAERVFMLHRLKNEPSDGVCWANSNYIQGKFSVSINDFRNF